MRVSRAARGGALLGAVFGIVYAFGGLVIDALTTGLNQGTALAFLALIGMPVIGAAIGSAIAGSCLLARRG